MRAQLLDEKIRIAVLGGSFNSAIGSAHRMALRTAGSNEIVGGMFSRDSGLSEFSNKWWASVNQLPYSSLDEMKARAEDFDCVLVLTPPELHLKSISTFLELNKRVISEKPTVSNLGEIREIRKIIEAGSGSLRTTYNYSGYPMVRELKQRIESGQFGRILNLRIQMFQEGFIRLDSDGKKIFPQPWRLADGEIPTVSLDLGTHVLHLFLYMLGELPSTGFTIAKSEGHFDVIDRVEFLGSTNGGVTANIGWGKTSLGFQNGLKVEIFGDQGSAIWVQTNPETLQIADKNGEIHFLTRGNPSCLVANQNRFTRFKGGHPSGFIEALTNVYEDFFGYESTDKDSPKIYDIYTSEDIFQCLDNLHKLWIK